MAALLIDADAVTVHMSETEKVAAIHRDLAFPRTAITGLRVVSSGMNEVHGFKLLGSSIPGVMMVGTFRSQQGSTFAVCHGNGPAIAIELKGEHFDRIVVTLDDPEQVASLLL